MADYQGKKVVIIGLGLTGLSCVDFFLARGVTPRVMDTRVSPPGLDKLPEQVERHLGGLNDDWLLAADLIVASPGMALAHPSLSAAADAGVEIVGDIDLTAAKVRGIDTVINRFNNFLRRRFTCQHVGVGHPRHGQMGV